MRRSTARSSHVLDAGGRRPVPGADAVHETFERGLRGLDDPLDLTADDAAPDATFALAYCTLLAHDIIAEALDGDPEDWPDYIQLCCDEVNCAECALLAGFLEGSEFSWVCATCATAFPHHIGFWISGTCDACDGVVTTGTRRSPVVTTDDDHAESCVLQLIEEQPVLRDRLRRMQALVERHA